MSIREYDEHCEKIMSNFLYDNFYKLLNPISIERISERNLQIKGIDIILNIDNKIYNIDEKASIRYINLKTFALELSFLDRNNCLKTGWFLDESKINNYYLFVWINELNDDLIYTINSIKDVDVALVNKDDIVNYLNSIGWTKSKLLKKDNNIRREEDTSMGNIKKHGCKFSFSKQLKERPINILLPKETYIKIAEIYKNIRINKNNSLSSSY